MYGRASIFAALIGLLGVGDIGSQTNPAPHPCSLLTAQQIKATLGTLGESHEADMPGTGHDGKPLRRTCSWSIPGGLFTLSVGKTPNANQSTRELLDDMNHTYDMLRELGWSYAKGDIGNTSCSMIAPPPVAPDGSPATTCGTVVKGMLVIAGASSKVVVSADKIRFLVETAASQIH